MLGHLCPPPAPSLKHDTINDPDQVLNKLYWILEVRYYSSQTALIYVKHLFQFKHFSSDLISCCLVH